MRQPRGRDTIRAAELGPERSCMDPSGGTLSPLAVPPVRVRRLWLLLPLLAAITAIGVATTAFATITDSKTAWHYYAGFSCLYGGVSQLATSGGSSGSAILSQECTNGYRELYTEARTTTNQVLSRYSGWVLYDYSWSFSPHSDLCQIVGNHRMSKAG